MLRGGTAQTIANRTSRPPFLLVSVTLSRKWKVSFDPGTYLERYRVLRSGHTTRVDKIAGMEVPRMLVIPSEFPCPANSGGRIGVWRCFRPFQWTAIDVTSLDEYDAPRADRPAEDARVQARQHAAATTVSTPADVQWMSPGTVACLAVHAGAAGSSPAWKSALEAPGIEAGIVASRPPLPPVFSPSSVRAAWQTCFGSLKAGARS